MAAPVMRSVVLTPYDENNQLLADFQFEQPVTVTLGYDPALIHRGLVIDLQPKYFNPLSGRWERWESDFTLDIVSNTVTFPIVHTGEYGRLFSVPAGVDAELTAFTPSGVTDLAGGTIVTYTLSALNTTLQPVGPLTLTHTLPTGLTFLGWAQANGATLDNGTLTWSLPTLAAGGRQWASFTAQVSADPGYEGKTIVSTAALAGPAGLSAMGQASIGLGEPPTPVTDTVTTPPDTSISLWPLTNDGHPGQSPLVIAALGTPDHGVATLAGDRVTYTPTASYQGTDVVTYTAQAGAFSAEGVIRLRVIQLASLTVSQTVATAAESGTVISSVVRGTVITYTLTLSNAAGSATANSVMLTDTLPAGVEFAGFVLQSGAVLNGNTIAWNAASMPTDTAVTIVFQAAVTGAEGTGVANRVEVTAANAYPTAGSAAFGILQWQRLYLPPVQR